MLSEILPQSAKISPFHNEMVSRAITAINEIFGDVTVDTIVIQSSLTGLVKHIQKMQETLVVK